MSYLIYFAGFSWLSEGICLYRTTLQSNQIFQNFVLIFVDCHNLELSDEMCIVLVCIP